MARRSSTLDRHRYVFFLHLSYSLGVHLLFYTDRSSYRYISPFGVVLALPSNHRSLALFVCTHVVVCGAPELALQLICAYNDESYENETLLVCPQVVKLAPCCTDQVMQKGQMILCTDEVICFRDIMGHGCPRWWLASRIAYSRVT